MVDTALATTSAASVAVRSGAGVAGCTAASSAPSAGVVVATIASSDACGSLGSTSSTWLAVVTVTSALLADDDVANDDVADVPGRLDASRADDRLDTDETCSPPVLSASSSSASGVTSARSSAVSPDGCTSPVASSPSESGCGRFAPDVLDFVGCFAADDTVASFGVESVVESADDVDLLLVEEPTPPPGDPVSSADAMPHPVPTMTAVPTPNATANPPTRPTCFDPPIRYLYTRGRCVTWQFTILRSEDVRA